MKIQTVYERYIMEYIKQIKTVFNQHWLLFFFIFMGLVYRSFLGEKFTRSVDLILGEVFTIHIVLMFFATTPFIFFVIKGKYKIRSIRHKNNLLKDNTPCNYNLVLKVIKYTLSILIFNFGAEVD